jgi:sortase (surface protein transpeptidase)
VSELDLPESGLAPADLVRIPIIGLESKTTELGVITTNEGDLKYESPIFEVGIIPGHTTPGERGNTWLFGHLESPLKDEGAVFRDLPKLHDFLRNGEAVYVIVDSADGSFLYQATEFRIMRAEDVTFWDSDGRTATLVCSWPRFIYNERVVVTAELVGARLNRPLS